MLPLALTAPDPTIPIRPARLSDAEALFAACWPQRTFAVVFSLLQRITRLQDAGRGLGLVVLDRGGLPVGYGQVALWPTCAEISDLVVAEGQRGRGSGTAIIQRLTQAAVEIGAEAAEIGAALSNPRALKLYRSLGFEDSHTVMINLGAGQEPVLFLRLDLTRGRLNTQPTGRGD
jgi:ribosomal protein S18 acetylase RimI-like enzyme